MEMRNVGPEVEMREMVDRSAMKMNTAIPGIIESFDPATQTATVTPAIKMRTMIDNEEGFLSLPTIIHVPVVYPVVAVKGFALTLPISKGDNCLLVFSQRAIDNWHDRGSVQPPEEGVNSRHHDLTDAFALISPLPLPQVFGDWEANGLELRNRAKSSRVTVRDSEIEIQRLPDSIVTLTGSSITLQQGGASTVTLLNGSITIQQGGSIVLVDSAGVTITGNLLVSGSVTSQTSMVDPKGDMEEMRGDYNQHKHGTSPLPDTLME